jgi:hypothetical protein
MFLECSLNLPRMFPESSWLLDDIRNDARHAHVQWFTSVRLRYLQIVRILEFLSSLVSNLADTSLCCDEHRCKWVLLGDLFINLFLKPEHELVGGHHLVYLH